MLSLQSIWVFLPLNYFTTRRPVYRFAKQIRELSSVWLEIFLEGILKQIAILILILITVILIAVSVSVFHRLKDVLVFTNTKPESISKLRSILRQNLILFIIILYIFEKQAWHEANIFFSWFCFSFLTHWFVFPSMYIH